MRALHRLGAVLLAGSILGSACVPGSDARRSELPLPSEDPVREELAPAVVDPTPPAPKARVESRTFHSISLGRDMPYRIYLPPQYTTKASTTFPALYLLHGLGGSADQWLQVGAAAAADRMIRSGDIAPLVIVMPEGEGAYWVDHADGGPKWGAYVAVDLVRDVEATYHVEAGKTHRAIGGLSMGAHGALQLAMNYPSVFGVVGAHSLVLRRYESAPPFFGGPQEFAKRDPMGLVRTKTDVCRSLALWIDIGKDDPWAPLAQRFDRDLTELRIPHQWHMWPGDHSGAYWSAHLPEYLRYYDTALSGSPSWDTRLRLPLVY